MEKKKLIYMDKKGYEKLINEIDLLKKELEDLRINKADAYENGGDGFHDNFAFEDSERNERALMYRLSESAKMLENVVIVDKQVDEDVIDINDVFSLTIDFGDDLETDTYRLISSADTNSDDGVINISLNSPLGKAIYLKKVGEHTNYVVNNHKFLVHINEKIAEETLKKDSKHHK